LVSSFSSATDLATRDTHRQSHSKGSLSLKVDGKLKSVLAKASISGSGISCKKSS